MLKKIKNLPASEISAYIKSADIVVNKCNQILEAIKNLPANSGMDEDINKVLAIRSEHFGLIQELQHELERRMQKHFSLKHSGVQLNLSVKRFQEKIDAQKENSRGSVDKSEMKVLK